MLSAVLNSNVLAGEESLSLDELKQGLDTVWVLLGAFLVFFMQAGFGMVEAGFIRAKNTCNILTKNFLDFCMASPGFFLIGYFVDETIDAIVKGARTGQIGDGKILVLDLPQCVRIRTGEEGNKAIG